MGRENVLRQARGRRIGAVAAVGSLALAAAGCGKPPKDETPGSGGSATAGKDFSACMVTDTGGIDDRSFNASAWKGLQDAAKENKNIKPKYVPSKAEADYEPNLTAYAQQKCDLVVAVGGLMADATKKVATANPNVKFAIFDSTIDLPNVYSLQFDTAQAGFLAGYLAAGTSKTGKVATYGGLKIPPVTIFMDGFADGVAQYNQVKGKTVAVLGWDKKAQNGTFAESFTDQNKGKAISDNFVAQGADVIMPVAGGTGIGTASAAAGKYSVVWVDTDGCESAQQFCSTFLTTVVKGIPTAVKQAALDTAAGKPATTGFVGTLENNGVSIAPYHEFDSKVPADLKAEIDKLKQDIISGTVKVTSPNQPATK